MSTILIILALIALAVGIVAWATRRKPAPDLAQRQIDQDTAWNDPISAAENSVAATDDPFAHAPPAQPDPKAPH